MLVLTEAATEVVKSVTSTPQTPDGTGLRKLADRGGYKGVAEFLDLDRVKPNTLGNTRMLLRLLSQKAGPRAATRRIRSARPDPRRRLPTAPASRARERRAAQRSAGGG